MTLKQYQIAARGRPSVPMIERLESRVLLSVTTPAKPAYPISDIFGAVAGIPLSQNGPAAVAGNSGGTQSGSGAPAATAPLIGTAGETLFAGATAPGGSTIFSVLPILPPEGLAAVMLGLVNPFDRYGSVISTKAQHAAGAAGQEGLRIR